MYFFYYYPIGVDVDSPRVPVATLGLCALMAALYLLIQPWAGLQHVEWYRLVYRPAEQSLWTPLTACFLHAGWLHLGGNLLYIYVFAPALETALGRLGMLLIFCGTGYLGNLAQGVLTLHLAPENAWVGVVGASGGVSGILGFFLLRFYYAKIKLAYWVFLPLQGINRTGIARLSVVFGLLLWLALQVAYAVVQGDGAGTAHGAHLGGLAAGCLLALATGQLLRAQLSYRRVKARRQREDGNLHAAAGQMQRYLDRCAWDLEAWLELARILSAARQWGRAQAIYRDVVEHLLESGDLPRTAEIYMEARRGNQMFSLPPQTMQRVAFWLEKCTRFREAVSVYLDIARLYPAHPAREHALARAATLTVTRLGDRREGLALLETALNDFPEGQWRAMLERERERWLMATSPNPTG